MASAQKSAGFKHHILSSSHQGEFQLKINQPIKRLQKDMHTYWNSTYYMILFPFEQKRPQEYMSPNTSSPNNVTTHQVASFGEEVCVLTPFEKLKLNELKLKSRLMHCSGIRYHSRCGCNLAIYSGERWRKWSLPAATDLLSAWVSFWNSTCWSCLCYQEWQTNRKNSGDHLQGSFTRHIPAAVWTADDLDR